MCVRLVDVTRASYVGWQVGQLLDEGLRRLYGLCLVLALFVYPLLNVYREDRVWHYVGIGC